MPAWEVSQWMKQMFDLLHEEILDEEVEFYLPQLAGNNNTTGILHVISSAAEANQSPLLL